MPVTDRYYVDGHGVLPAAAAWGNSQFVGS